MRIGLLGCPFSGRVAFSSILLSFFRPTFFRGYDTGYYNSSNIVINKSRLYLGSCVKIKREQNRYLYLSCIEGTDLATMRCSLHLFKESVSISNMTTQCPFFRIQAFYSIATHNDELLSNVWDILRLLLPFCDLVL